MYMKKEYAPNYRFQKIFTRIENLCNKIKSFVSYYSKLIQSYNKAAYNVLENEIRLLFPQVSESQKCGIITTLVSSFTGLANEGISSFLQ